MLNVFGSIAAALFWTAVTISVKYVFTCFRSAIYEELPRVRHVHHQIQPSILPRSLFALHCLAVRQKLHHLEIYLYSSSHPSIMAAKYHGPHAAELALAFEIAAEAGRMITSASAKRWQQSSNEQGGAAGSSEPGTKKNSVDVRLSFRSDSLIPWKPGLTGFFLASFSARHWNGSSCREASQRTYLFYFSSTQVHWRRILRWWWQTWTYGRTYLDCWSHRWNDVSWMMSAISTASIHIASGYKVAGNCSLSMLYTDNIPSWYTHACPASSVTSCMASLMFAFPSVSA